MFTHYGFIFLGPETDPTIDRTSIERGGFRTDLVAVPNPAAAVPVATELVDSGVQLLELCGAFGPTCALGVVLRRARLDRGCSLREVAEQADVSLSHLSAVERGLSEPSSEVLAALCRSLGSRSPSHCRLRSSSSVLLSVR